MFCFYAFSRKGFSFEVILTKFMWLLKYNFVLKFFSNQSNILGRFHVTKNLSSILIEFINFLYFFFFFFFNKHYILLNINGFSSWLDYWNIILFFKYCYTSKNGLTVIATGDFFLLCLFDMVSIK